MPVLRRRAARWCLENDLPEAALEYAMAAGDIDMAAGLARTLLLPTHWQGRRATLQRWFRWLEERGGLEKHPVLAAQGAILFALTARPVEAERWADTVDRWQYQDAARHEDPSAEAWAAVLRAILCRRGTEQMRADADEAIRGFAAQHVVAPAAALTQGLARVLSGDLDGADAASIKAVGIGQETGGHETVAVALCERSLTAIARNQWSRAQTLAEQARGAMRRAEIEESFATPLLCAVHARIALHRGDLPAVRRELVSAQRLRTVLTYALPHLAVQARIELASVYLALTDLAGARTLMEEVDELLRRRPGLGTLAEALRARLVTARRSSAPGALALTAAELRLLPMLATHLSFPEIAQEMFLSRHTVRSQAMSIYRKLEASSRSQAVTRSRELGLLEGDDLSFMQSAERRSPAHEAGCCGSERRHMGQTERFQEILRRLAIFDEGFVEDEARLGLDPAGTSTLDPKTSALLHVGASAAIGSSAVCLEGSAARAMAAGATKDEIADALLAIAAVAGLGRIVSAAPEVATALEYDITAALEEPDGP